MTLSTWWLFILMTFVGGWDSGGKNQLVYHDPESDGPWRFVPWDFNASWGQQWETSRVTADSWDDLTWTNNLFYRSLNRTRSRASSKTGTRARSTRARAPG